VLRKKLPVQDGLNGLSNGWETFQFRWITKKGGISSALYQIHY